MDIATINKIIEKANYSIQKPRKKKDDMILMVAGILVAGATKGDDWANEQLKNFGWKKPITAEEKIRILEEAERLIKEE